MNIAELKGEKPVKTLAGSACGTDERHAENYPGGHGSGVVSFESAAESDRRPRERDADCRARQVCRSPPMVHRANPRPDRRVLCAGGKRAGNICASYQERTEQFTLQSDQVQTWLKSQQAKDLVKESPELKEVFSDASSAARALPKEQAASVTAETKALEKVEAEVKVFRTTNLSAVATRAGALTKPSP